MKDGKNNINPSIQNTGTPKYVAKHMYMHAGFID